jgi:hypothetical protein
VADKVDPRTEADAQIARALEIVVNASSTIYGKNVEQHVTREYTIEELEELFFVLGSAMVQLMKVPNGKEAKERHYANIKAELARRGRKDLIEYAESD